MILSFLKSSDQLSCLYTGKSISIIDRNKLENKWKKKTLVCHHKRTVAAAATTTTKSRNKLKKQEYWREGSFKTRLKNRKTQLLE